MLVGRHDRVLAIDGAYIHVFLLSTLLSSLVHSPTTYRSCPRPTRPRPSSTAERPHRTTSRAWSRVSSLPSPHPHSNSSCTVTAARSDTTLRPRVQRSLVRPARALWSPICSC